MSKRGQSEYLITPMGREVIDLLSSEDNNFLDIIEHLYAGIDRRGCPNIQFTTEEPTYERGNIIVMF